jgi:hypothetical protein
MIDFKSSAETSDGYSSSELSSSFVESSPTTSSSDASITDQYRTQWRFSSYLCLLVTPSLHLDRSLCLRS